MLKNYLALMVILLAIPQLQAQFDDVYYNPDFLAPEIRSDYGGTMPGNTPEDGVTYYDNEEYAYGDDYGYDEYDYYYSSRLRRFYQPYIGFGFYDPIYVGYNYYDPYAWDYYGYPGANIYLGFDIGFGFGIGFSYGSYWNNWYYPPYYGCGGYYGYGGYNPYYNPCYGPPGYYGGSCGGGYYGGYDDHHDGNGDYYYGPRITGNTGSSPRGPATIPGTHTPIEKESNGVIAESGDRPVGLPEPGGSGRSTPSGTPVVSDPHYSPVHPDAPRVDDNTGVVRQIPVDKELKRDETVSSPKRPVFRPDVEKYQPYPTPERTNPGPKSPKTDNPSYRPYSPQGRPSGAPKDLNRSNLETVNLDHTPIRADQLPTYTPPTRNNQDRPSYSPPPRSTPKSDQTQASRSDDRPSPPSTSSPSTRSDNSRSNNSPSHSSPSSSGRSGSSSSGSNRSSGGGSSGSTSSPRGRG